MATLLILSALLALIPAFVGARKVPARRNSVFATMYVFGFLLWIVALPYAIWFVKDERPGAQDRQRPQGGQYKECPHCKEQMRRDASVCPHCQRESRAWTLNDGFWWSQDPHGGWHWLDEQANEWRQLPTSHESPMVVAANSATGMTAKQQRPDTTAIKEESK